MGEACAAALHDRGFEGDEELAAEIESALGSRPAPLLKAIAVDVEELSEVLEGDPALNQGGRLDLETGEVWALGVAGEVDDDEQEEDPDRWLNVECLGSGEGYRDMELFSQSLAGGQLRGRLPAALVGRRPFRRFKDALGEWPEELERWCRFSEERRHGRARSWLAEEGYPPAVRTEAASG